MTGDVGKLYSEALYEIGLENNNLDELNNDVKQCRTVFEENPELVKLLGSPVITNDEKIGVISSIFGESGTVRDFICVVTQKGRIGWFSDIAEEFRLKCAEHDNIAEMTVITSIPLKDAQREKLTKKLEEKSGKKIKLSEKTDPSILGGIIIEYGNTRIDDSIKGKLEAVARQLKQ